ncbi:hypothetical protein H5410_022834 [Solanum commersonii]|uniref:DUF4283 domain-containing protein n=1 Tax=Solanum commersonii TaxID=4109 RepID=A0A9J5ZF52_SOLCO|nr:hypothetical protein H5410_022834 [Solanum commersonii]
MAGDIRLREVSNNKPSPNVAKPSLPNCPVNMAATASGQPPPEVGLLAPSGPSYADSLKQPRAKVKSLPLKPISYLHGEPQVIWEHEEVNQMIINENLEYAVIGKFSYGWPEIQDLRKLIPKQCELKGECNIGLLSNRHVLIRAMLLEDYVHLLSKPAFYITQKNWSFPMRTLKWDPMFNPEEETSTAIAWISFPSLPPIFFGKEAVFLLAAAVGKPLQVDMATKNQTRPSCTRVKVEVDLLKEFPKRIKIGMRMKNEEVLEKWIKIKYDYVPKYCKTCMIQGHNEQQCYVEHLELYRNNEKIDQGTGKQKEEDNKKERREEGKEAQVRGGDQQKDKNTDEFMEQRHKKWGGKKKLPEQVWNKVDVITGNKFNMLEHEAQEEAGVQLKKVAEIGVDEESSTEDQGTTPGIQKSNNKRNPNRSNKDGMEKDIEEIETVTKKGPDLGEENEDEIQFRMETEEDEDIDYNISHD